MDLPEQVRKSPRQDVTRENIFATLTARAGEGPDAGPRSKAEPSVNTQEGMGHKAGHAAPRMEKFVFLA